MGHARLRPKHLAAKLLTLRQSLGLSQPQIAKRLGIQEYTKISKYERNINEPPLAVLLGYATFIGVSVDVLIDDERDLQFEVNLTLVGTLLPFSTSKSLILRCSRSKKSRHF